MNTVPHGDLLWYPIYALVALASFALLKFWIGGMVQSARDRRQIRAARQWLAEQLRPRVIDINEPIHRAMWRNRADD